MSSAAEILQPLAAELKRFVSALFRYADEIGYVSLRVLPQYGQPGERALHIAAVQVRRGVDAIVRAAVAACMQAVTPDRPGVFAPPVATFRGPISAAEGDVLNGVALSVELDKCDPVAARARLERLLGPVTVALHSGSEWIDEHGVMHKRAHLHWRLNEPTRTPEDHGRLKLARRMAALLVGADLSAVPICHPLRWPGSWNLKNKPVMATMFVCDEAAEIDLADALDRLADAIEAAGLAMDTSPHLPNATLAAGDMARLAGAVAAIPNADVEWNEFNRTGMALFAATAGAREGYDLFADWSAKSAKHNEAAIAERWAAYAISPPTRIGTGTLIFLAKAAGWGKPVEVGALGVDEVDFAPPPEPDMPGHLRDQRDVDPDKPGHRREIEHEDIHAITETDDFVEGLLTRRALSIVYGKPNAGKTFFVTDLALHVAAGMTWQGREITHGAVLYFALEGTFGISNRVAAFKREHKTNGQRVPFVLITGALDLRNSSGDADYVVRLARKYAQRYGLPVALVVIDTVARAMAGGNENASEDMGALIKNLDLIARETGANVMGIHHSGKDETRGARGWSGLRAAIDTEIEVRDAGAVKTATVLKQRDLPKGAQFNFTLQQVVLGQNERGKDVTSCVVKAASGDGFQAGLSRRSDALKGTKRHVYQCLVDAINDRPERGFGCPDDACSVPESVWRDRFYRTTVGDQTPDAKRMQFRRYAATLQAEHFVAILDGRAWLVSAADEPR